MSEAIQACWLPKAQEVDATPIDAGTAWMVVSESCPNGYGIEFKGAQGTLRQNKATMVITNDKTGWSQTYVAYTTGQLKLCIEDFIENEPPLCMICGDSISMKRENGTWACRSGHSVTDTIDV